MFFKSKELCVQHAFHRVLLLADADEKEDAVEGHSYAERCPSVAEKRDTQQLWEDVEKVVRVTNGAEEETSFDALVGHDIEFERPNIAKFVDHIKEHRVGKEHYSSSRGRHTVEGCASGVSLIERTEIESNVCQGEQEGVSFAVLHGSELKQSLLVANRISQRKEAQREENRKGRQDVVHSFVLNRIGLRRLGYYAKGKGVCIFRVYSPLASAKILHFHQNDKPSSVLSYKNDAL